MTGGAKDRAAQPRITLIGKPGCHLCDDAREVVARVAAETGTGWRELSILDDAGVGGALLGADPGRARRRRAARLLAGRRRPPPRRAVRPPPVVRRGPRQARPNRQTEAVRGIGTREGRVVRHASGSPYRLCASVHKRLGWSRPASHRRSRRRRDPTTPSTARPPGPSHPGRDPRGDGVTPAPVPAGPHHAGRGRRRHGLVRGAGRGRRRRLGQAAQGPLAPRLVRHPRRRLRGRVPRQPDLPRARPDPGLARRHRRRRQPRPRARQLRRVRDAAGSPSSPCWTPRESVVGEKVAGLPVQPVDDLEDVVRALGVQIGVVATPAPRWPRRSATGWSRPASPASSTSRPACCRCPPASWSAGSTCRPSCRSSPSTSSAGSPTHLAETTDPVGHAAARHRAPGPIADGKALR